MDRLLTVKDVAEYLQMSKEKVYKLAQRIKPPVSSAIPGSLLEKKTNIGFVVFSKNWIKLDVGLC